MNFLGYEFSGRGYLESLRVSLGIDPCITGAPQVPQLVPPKGGGGLLVNLHQLGLIFPGKNLGFRCFPRETLTFRLRTENRMFTVPFLQYCALFSQIGDFSDQNCDLREQKFVVFCPRRAGFLSRKSLFTKKSVQYCRNEAG